MIKGRNFKISSDELPLLFKAETSCTFEFRQEAVEVNNMPTDINQVEWLNFIPAELSWSLRFSGLMTEKHKARLFDGIVPTLSRISIAGISEKEHPSSTLDITGKVAITSRSIKANTKGIAALDISMDGCDIPQFDYQ